MKKKVLMIIPFEKIYPPKNGGLQRCFHLFHQLAKYTELTAITHDSPQTFLSATKCYPAIANATVYSTYNKKLPGDLFSLLPRGIGDALRYRWITKNFTRSADGSFLKFHRILKKLLQENDFDFIILENLQLTYYAPWLKKRNKNAQIIFNAYNVESIIAQRKPATTPGQQQEISNLLHVESSLYRIIDGIFCCSQIDLDVFSKLNQGKIKSGFVLPNGVDTTLLNHSLNTSEEQLKKVIFCGSLGYEPNKEGLLWFYKNVWPRVTEQAPGSLLYVVGRGGKEAYTVLLNDKTVRFIGEVEDVVPYYRECGVAIAPLMNGSGTRFKILEAMSLGNPVLTTTIGVEGIDCVDGKNIVIADSPESFANKLVGLMLGTLDNVSISESARSLVEEKYSWNVIGVALSEFLLHS